MKTMVNLFLVAAFAISAQPFSKPAAPKDPAAAFGACYTLYNCQGGSMGVFTDIQCRSMGGHSMDSAGICINL